MSPHRARKTAFLYRKIRSRSFMAFDGFFMWLDGKCSARLQIGHGECDSPPAQGHRRS
ncbi:MAG: hypothetical protein OJF50_002710 [Nitrospira sp.]|nr:hypothetical protein [Nitrospira sp.]